MQGPLNPPEIRPRVTIIAIVMVAMAAALGATFLGGRAASATDFPVISSTSSAYPQRVDWATACTVVKSAPDDPILFPGSPGKSHDHTFSGNIGISAWSTASQLATTGTTCAESNDRSAYWMPSLLVNGKKIIPYTTRAYYRAGTFSGRSIKPMPFGLKLIAGNATAMSPQHSDVAGFQCRIEDRGAVVDKQSLPPSCPGKSFLEASVVFPNCWDGIHLDSADHRSHMSYAVNFHCDSAHPVQIPQLTVAERFAAGTTKGVVTLSAMNSPYTLHADFINAWTPSVMQTLVTRCIGAGVACEDVSDHRFPPAP